MIAATAVPESVAVICPVEGLADMPRQRLKVHWFCGDSVSLSTCENVIPLPLMLEHVTPERHATHTRIRSFALGVHDVALMLETLVPEPVTVAAVLMATYLGDRQRERQGPGRAAGLGAERFHFPIEHAPAAGTVEDTPLLPREVGVG